MRKPNIRYSVLNMSSNRKMRRPLNRLPLVTLQSFAGVVLTGVFCAASAGAAMADPYAELVLRDKPVAYWRFDAGYGAIGGKGAADLKASLVGSVAFGTPGPRYETFAAFGPDNAGATFGEGAAYIRVKDPGEKSPLDFDKGESITIEAWVNPATIGKGSNVYVVGKGRTQLPGTLPNNHNYAVRLWNRDGRGGQISFLFRAKGSERKSGTDHWHRWTSDAAIKPASGWHHIVVSYTFGKKADPVAYIDGAEVKGAWDYGGATENAPVVDDDELWIGSSLSGSVGNSFHGSIDEIAIYRKVVSRKAIEQRFRFTPPGLTVDPDELPKDALRVEIIEGMPAKNSWNFLPMNPVETYEEPAFAFVRSPEKYNHRGVRIDRSNPYVIRASGVMTMAAGERRLMLRSLQGARLHIDGKRVAQTAFIAGPTSGHGEVPDVPTDLPSGLRFARTAHHDEFFTWKSDGKPHVFVLEAMVGGAKKIKRSIGEISLSVLGDDNLYRVAAPRDGFPHNDGQWDRHVARQNRRLTDLDHRNRVRYAAKETEYWATRHELARKSFAEAPAISVPKSSAEQFTNNEIDHFIGARLEAAGVEPASLIDDWAFLRRLSLDTIGVVPSPEQIAEFREDKSKERRANAIQRFLAHPGWADHWVAYWQDVLAENPGILKPSLNNTGPFRWWIHESFIDNKPIDRFATELILMEGSVYGGGPAGFGLATQNDVPMADRAQIVSRAFLAMNLSCARCHDAPYHDFMQKDLFSLAAMLKKGPQEVPASSSIPAVTDITVGRLVNVTLKPGSKVEPDWPFHDVMKGQFAKGVVRDGKNTREQLAASITDPRNERFARVIVNRLWKRYLGLGLVEPVDDWETSKPSHPALLDWLARELATHDYDLKRVASLIFNSQAYQRQAGLRDPETDEPKDRLFASPQRRRLSAEQLVDSLYAAVGKPMRTEELTLDNDGRRPSSSFLSLGYPKRAWEFTTMSNDRDRPALSMPRTQEIVDLLSAFGWRETRQNSLSERDHSSNVLQPAGLANGGVGAGRVTRLSEDCAVTEMSLRKQSPVKLVDALFLRVLSRLPSDDERAAIVAHLERGYEKRVVPGAKPGLKKEYDPGLLLSWSNHLNARATEYKMIVEERARQGDEPTARLEADWRERMEDALWALVNSPEFVFAP